MNDVTKTVMKFAEQYKQGQRYEFDVEELVEFASKVFTLGRDIHVMQVQYKAKGK